MDFVLGLIIGLAAGWVLARRPRWLSDLTRKIRE